MKKNVKTVGLIGSIRSNHNHIEKLENLIKNSGNLENLLRQIDTCEYVYSNTDISVAVALLGAYENGSDIRLISLVDLFRHRNENLYKHIDEFSSIEDLEEIDTLSLDGQKLKQILSEIDESDGVILGSPVYFGDRSSVANKILQVMAKSNMLENKAFGAVSTGAKRNGGQETAIIYTLYEAMMQGALITGNGPKTAQYGGTVFAGDVGKATSDQFGMETSYGTGRQVSQLAKILKEGEAAEQKKEARLLFLITIDDAEHSYENRLHEYLHRRPISSEYEIINLTDKNIYRCISCSSCPSPKLTEQLKDETDPYNCVVQTSRDAMKYLREKMNENDVIVLVGVNSDSPLTYRYQAFMERTRFIRRNDFELTNKVILSLTIDEVGAVSNPIFDIKTLTSFIRHNTILMKPLRMFYHDGAVIKEPNLSDYLPSLNRVLTGRKNVSPVVISYKATGYENKTLDRTEALRG